MGVGENFLLTGYQVVQKSGSTMKRHVAATLVERWLVNPEEAGEASLAQGRKTKMAAKRKAKAKGKAKKKAKKKGKK
jgi:hypothetical protein